MKFLIFSIALSILSGCNLNNESKEPSIQISGTIYGLNSDMELILNNGEFLNISYSNDSHIHNLTIQPKLSNSANFEIAVSRQPENQHCLIENQIEFSEEISNYNIRIWCYDYWKSLNNVSAVSSGDDHSCAISNKELDCWGANNPYPHIDLPNPTIISTGLNSSCAANNENIICWNGNEKLSHQINTSKIVELEVSWNDNYCIINQEGLQCLGSDNFLLASPLNLVSPSHLSIGVSNACVIDEKQPVCWGFPSEAINLPPDLVEIDDISISLHHGCATSFGQVTCWGDGGDYNAATVPSDLSYAYGIEVSNHNSCAITDTGIRCWGYDAGLSVIQYLVSNPSILSLGTFKHACAIENEKLICSGDREQLILPPSWNAIK